MMVSKGKISIFLVCFYAGLVGSAAASGTTANAFIDQLKELGFATELENIKEKAVPKNKNGVFILRKHENLHTEKFAKLSSNLPYNGNADWETEPPPAKTRKAVEMAVLFNPKFKDYYKDLERAAQLGCTFYADTLDADPLGNPNHQKMSMGWLADQPRHARALAEKSLILRSRGDFHGAVKCLRTGIKLVDSLAIGNSQTPRYVRAHCLLIHMKELRRVLADEDPHPDLCGELMHALSNQSEKPRFAEALRFEILKAVQNYRWMSKLSTNKQIVALKLIYQGKLAQQEIEELVKHPNGFAEEFFLSQMKRLSGAVVTADQSWFNLKTQNLIPDFGSALAHLSKNRHLTAQAEAECGMAIIVLGNRLHYWKHGNYAAQLTDLVDAEVLAKLPMDPFSGQPFCYSSTGKGFVVWSFGENLKDDQTAGDDRIWKIERGLTATAARGIHQ